MSLHVPFFLVLKLFFSEINRHFLHTPQLYFVSLLICFNTLTFFLNSKAKDGPAIGGQRTCNAS